MSDVVAVIVAALAVWRIAAWLWYETGAERTRARLSRWPWAARQLDCFWCVSFWVALAVSPVVLLAWWLLLPVALSGAAILLSGGGRILWREMVRDE